MRKDHGAYGIQVMRQAVGDAFNYWGPSRHLDYSGCGADIDGTVGELIAVEIEARVPKQVRGAILDLFFHAHPIKLLLLVPTKSLGNPTATAKHCEHIFLRLGVPPENFRVVLLTGMDGNEQLAHDVPLVRQKVAELGGPLQPPGPSLLEKPPPAFVP